MNKVIVEYNHTLIEIEPYEFKIDNLLDGSVEFSCKGKAEYKFKEDKPVNKFKVGDLVVVDPAKELPRGYTITNSDMITGRVEELDPENDEMTVEVLEHMHTLYSNQGKQFEVGQKYFILKEEKKEMNKLVEGLENTNRETVHTSDYIVATKDKVTGRWSMSTTPFIHKTYREALVESQRLAQKDPTKKFVVLAVVAVSEVTEVNTTYRL